MALIRIPSFLRDHPVESLLAVMLLAGLLFITADGTQPRPLNGAVVAAAEKN